MANKRNKKTGRAELAYQRGVATRSARVKEFLRRAPQFTNLVEIAEGRKHELSRSQQEFLDDFATKIAAVRQSPNGKQIRERST